MSEIERMTKAEINEHEFSMIRRAQVFNFKDEDKKTLKEAGLTLYNRPFIPIITWARIFDRVRKDRENNHPNHFKKLLEQQAAVHTPFLSMAGGSSVWQVRAKSSHIGPYFVFVNLRSATSEEKNISEDAGTKIKNGGSFLLNDRYRLGKTIGIRYSSNGEPPGLCIGSFSPNAKSDELDQRIADMPKNFLTFVEKPTTRSDIWLPGTHMSPSSA